MTDKELYSMGWDHALDDMHYLKSFKLRRAVEIIKKHTIDINKDVEYWNGYRGCLKEFGYEGVFV